MTTVLVFVIIATPYFTKGVVMNIAQRIVDKFGGQTALASLIQKGQSTVQYWVRVGTIPTKWHTKLLTLAAERGIDLSPSDLVASDAISVDSQPVVEVYRIPESKWWGDLILPGDATLPCYVLDDGRRVISRSGATGILSDGKGGGNLESYLRVEALKPYVPSDLPGQMIEFSIDGVVNKTARGIEADTFLEICRAYVQALSDGKLQTDRQKEIAVKCGMFLAACAKVGLVALIDEATGYQYERPEDALQFKLRVYLEEEMRKWEKTFPDDLWQEFARLTHWQGGVTRRPKYWGKLVMELVYEYLDPDVAKWLKDNAPKPRGGQNYHQWLSSQYGLKKLTEHLWMLVGMARACDTMRDLREKMAAQFGRQEYQLTFFAPPPSRLHNKRPPAPDVDFQAPGESGSGDDDKTP
ncbi:MAG: P63C domain-containing protein [Planctomycetaceae bacterium]|nr:P63C domain-containing protein [Planctomycetaceae bacterium]